MLRKDRDANHLLYYGTLRRNLPSIKANGLTPQVGPWAARFHRNAVALVYAVDDEHRSAAILAIAGQMVEAGLMSWSEGYSFDDFKGDLMKHGAVVVVKADAFGHHPWSFESGHLIGAEPGNWYASETAVIEREIIEEEVLTWLNPSKEDFDHRYCPVIRELSALSP